MVTKELTVLEVLNANAALDRISNFDNMPLTLSFACQSVILALSGQVKMFNEKYKSIFEKFSTRVKDEDGKETDERKVSEENLDKYNKEVEKLFETKVKVSYNKINEEQLAGVVAPEGEKIGALLAPLVENFIEPSKKK